MSGNRDYLIPVAFTGLQVSAYQEYEKNYSITTREVQLYKGDIFGAISPVTRDFPRAFDCFTEDYSEISNLVSKIGTFGELVIGNTTYQNCYIAEFGAIREIIRGSGKYTYSIKFSQVDQY